MAGLARVTAVYRLLERMRIAEAAVAAAKVAEVEGEIAAAEAQREAACRQRNRQVDDAVARTGAEVALRAAGVRSGRLQPMLHNSRQVFEQAQLAVASSRLRVRQVEEVMMAEQRAQEVEATRREQASADERFLAQQFHAGRGR